MIQEELKEAREKAKRAFGGKEWETAADYLADLYQAGELSPEETVMLVVAIANCGETQAAAGLVSGETLRTARNTALIRTQAVAPAIREKRFADAEIILKRLVEAFPRDVANLSSLASVLIRAGRREEAVEHLERAVELEPDATALRNQLLLALIQSGRTQEAADIAAARPQLWPDDVRYAQLSLQALTREGRMEQAGAAAEAIMNASEVTADAAVAAAQHFIGAGQPRQALRVCSKALDAGEESPRLHYLTALSMHQLNDGREKALEHLRRAIELKPDDIKSLLLAGDLLMKEGMFRQAAKYLEDAVKIEPGLVHAKVALAQAFKFSRKFDRAAGILGEVARRDDVSDSWKRLAIASLMQDNRNAEARELYRAYRDRKAKHLPNSLVKGLEFLSSGAVTDCVPQKRLEWARELSEKAGAVFGGSREEWNRRACWGYKADSMIADWLEIKPDQSGELIQLFDDLSEGGERLRELQSLSNGGLLLVSAHIGPLYAGPLALQKLGIPHRWLASMPGIFNDGFAGTLISTSDKTEIEVVAEIYKALGEGNAVTIAVDGASSPAAPVRDFEGQQITYSDFAVKTCHRMNLPSAFAAPFWRDGRIGFCVEPLPLPETGEGRDDFIARWEEEFFSRLRSYFRHGPESLRLSGGLWRNIR